MQKMTPNTSNLTGRMLVAAVGICALGLGGMAPAAAAEQSPELVSPEELPELSKKNWEQAVFHTDPERAIIRFDMDRFIEQLGDRESDEDDVIVLAADILFAPNSWELPATASEKLEELVEEVPEGATVSVTGHTDSRPVPESFDFDNDELSEHRAQAVAEALTEQRPDFKITAEGLGDSEPAASENPDEPGTYAANRRVEIRYG